MYGTDCQKKPCYIVDENNQWGCKQYLELVPPDNEKLYCEREATNDLCAPNVGIQNQVHICMFCGKGFVGGTSCGKVCNNEVLKQKDFKPLKKVPPKPNTPKKKFRFCGCLRKNKKKEPENDCELRIKCEKNQKLFARVNRPSEVYIKKPCMSNDPSLNVISCQKTLKSAQWFDAERKAECRRPSYPQCYQDNEAPIFISPFQNNMQQPGYRYSLSSCPDKPVPHRGFTQPVCEDNVCTRYTQETVTPPCRNQTIPSCGKYVLHEQVPCGNQEKESAICPVAVYQEKANGSVVCQDKANPCGKCFPVNKEKVVICPAPVNKVKVTNPCQCAPVVQPCRCQCNSLSRTQMKEYLHKSKSEKLVGKKFHLLCQTLESSEETDVSSVQDNDKPPADKAKLKKPSPESSQLSGDTKKNVLEGSKTETKVGRVEINYCNRYFPFQTRLQRDNVPFKNRYVPFSAYSSSKHKTPLSSSNSNVSYLSVGRKKIKRSNFPVNLEDCKSCYLKVCKHGDKKKTVFSYSSGCSIKGIS